MLEEALLPFREVLECLVSREVEAECAAIGPSVEGVPNGLVLLLACSIPDLDSHDGIVNNNLLFLKIGTDRGFHIRWSFALSVSHKKRGFSNVRVTKYDDLEKVFPLGLFL